MCFSACRTDIAHPRDVQHGWSPVALGLCAEAEQSLACVAQQAGCGKQLKVRATPTGVATAAHQPHTVHGQACVVCMRVADKLSVHRLRCASRRREQTAAERQAVCLHHRQPSQMGTFRCCGVWCGVCKLYRARLTAPRNVLGSTNCECYAFVPLAALRNIAQWPVKRFDVAGVSDGRLSSLPPLLAWRHLLLSKLRRPRLALQCLVNNDLDAFCAMWPVASRLDSISKSESTFGARLNRVRVFEPAKVSRRSRAVRSNHSYAAKCAHFSRVRSQRAARIRALA